MIFEMPVENSSSSSYAFGRITTDDIEREIRRRGIDILQVVAPLPVEPEKRPVVIPELVPHYPIVLPRPESPVIVLPGDRDLLPEREPWLPQYPIPTEPELEELYTPPYEEELIMPLTPTVVPEAKPESKVALILIIAIVALVAFTNNDKGKQAAKWQQPITARSRAV